MKKTIALIIIFLGLATLRFYRLDLAPPHLSNDEISIAYDAYSVARTGRDEHNHWWPIAFQSFNTYKAPLYAYILAPLTRVLPNTEFTARAPSAFLGTMTIIAIGLVIFELTKNTNLAIVGGFLLGITPWHIYTSRMALEANVALFFLTMGVYFFLRAIRTKKWLTLFLAIISLALSMYGYHTEWVLTPMILAMLVLTSWNKETRKILISTGILFLILIMPLAVNYWQNRNTSARANSEVLWKEVHLEAKLKDPTINLSTKGLMIAKDFVGNYFDYTNLGYLFFNGLNLFPGLNAYQPGLWLAPLLPFFIWGLLNIAKFIKEKNKQIFFWGWILLAPVVPALTQGGTNIVRNLVTVIPYTIVIAMGLVAGWKQMAGWFKIVTVVSLTTAMAYFGMIYYIHFPIHAGENYQYGYRQMANFININYSDYDKIVVDPRFGDYNRFAGVPHLYLAYYTNLDPQKLLQRVDNNIGLFFDKYEIRGINWNLEVIKPKTLYLVPMSNLPEKKNLEEMLEISYPDHQPAFRIYRSN